LVERIKLTQKEKADLYDNWLAYVNGRGWTEVMAEPQKIKEKFDKLKKEIRYLQELNNGLNSACDIIKARNKKLTEDKKILSETLVEEVELGGKQRQEIDNLKQKLEKIKESCNNEISMVENTLAHPDWVLDDGELKGIKRVAELILEILDEK